MNTVATHLRRPEMVMGHPDWWHNHGHKMKVASLDKEGRTLILQGSAATVTVRKAGCGGLENPGWVVSWEVIQHVAFDEAVRGNCHFSDEELAAAFGVTDQSGRYGDWVIERYGAQAAEQGTFIRWQDFLNIPCPGTGHDGDPNVSVYVWNETKAAVQELLCGT